MKCIIVLLGLLIIVEAKGTTKPTHIFSKKKLIEISDILYEGLGALKENITGYTDETMTIENSLLYLFSDISNAINNNRFIKLLQEIFKGDSTPSIEDCKQVYELTVYAFMMDHYEHIFEDVTHNLKLLRKNTILIMQVAGSIRISIENNLENELALCLEDYKKCKITGEYITQVEDLVPLVDDLDYFMDILFRDSLYVKRIYTRSYSSQIWSRIFVPVHDCLVSGGYIRGII